MNDVDRWINLEGPEPPQIRELLAAARAGARRPRPGPSEEVERALHAALAAQRRRWARARSLKIGLGAGLVALGAAAAVTLLFVHAAPGKGGLEPGPVTNAMQHDPAPPSASSSSSAAPGALDEGGRPGKYIDTR
jgi:hypothetical protein